MGSQQWLYILISSSMVIASLILIYRIEKKKQGHLPEIGC
jgi:hypothetical protein